MFDYLSSGRPKNYRENQYNAQRLNEGVTNIKMELNYDDEKLLFVEVELPLCPQKQNLIIAPNGLVNSKRVKGENDESVTYFGHVENNNDVS